MTDKVKERQKAALAKEAARISEKYGHMTGALGSTNHAQGVTPTGSLALDYALGTGGWPDGHPVMIYGPRDIGKSSVLGLAALRNAQKRGRTTGIIAVEPGFSADWAAKHGVDPDLLVISRPNDGEVAFQVLYEWVAGDIVDNIVFDSIGALLRKTESGPDGKPNTGGASSLITHGVKNILQPCWKNSKGVILLNQQREDMKSKIPGQYKPPGGEALQHACDIIVELRPGGERLYVKGDEDEQVLVGRELVAKIERNKMAEGTNKKAKFKYLQMSTEKYGPVGIEEGPDVVNTAIRAGVISKEGNFFVHSAMPVHAKSGEHKLLGKDNAYEYLAENPDAAAQVREDVLKAMHEKFGPIKESMPTMEGDDE